MCVYVERVTEVMETIKTTIQEDVTLFTWKCSQEISLWGFTLDEKDPDFYQNYRKALLAKGEAEKMP